SLVDPAARSFYRRGMTVYLDFEKPVAALEARIQELQDTAEESEIDASSEIAKLRAAGSTRERMFRQWMALIHKFDQLR
ncbi:MAG: hypothetical protein ACK44T_08115, partial [Sphingomonadales bacterium]